MCSKPEERIAAIERAIDELAADAAAAYARPRRPAPRQAVPGQAVPGQERPGQERPGQSGPTAEHPADQADERTTGQAGDPIVARLAELWALLAELDPDVAGRLPRYQA